MNRQYVLSLACLALFSASAGLSQQSAAPTPPAGQDQGPPPRDFGHDGRRGGFGMGIMPPGMWWKNAAVVTRLALTADQQKRMDDIFHQSRPQLMQMKSSLEDEQGNLEPLLNANPPDQAKTLAEISRIADLRAELEKANAKMLIALRGVLTADQWTKLREHRPGEDGRGRFMNRPDGAGGQRSAPAPGGPAMDQ